MCVRMCVLVLNQMFFHQNFFNYIFFMCVWGGRAVWGARALGMELRSSVLEASIFIQGATSLLWDS